MSLISAATLASVRHWANFALSDTCQRLIYTTGAGGDYGTGGATYADGPSSPCLFVERPVIEAQGESQVQMADGRLYLPLTFALDARDRVRITAMNGEAIASPKTYTISKGPIIEDALLYAELSLLTE